MKNGLIIRNNDLVIAKAREELLKAIRFYLKINNNFIDLSATTQRMCFILHDSALDMDMTLPVNPIWLKEDAEGIKVSYTIDDDSYDRSVAVTGILEESTLNDCAQVLYALESLPVNCIRQYYVNGPDKFCDTIARELARKVKMTDSWEEIQDIAQKAKRFHFGKTVTTFGAVTESDHRSIKDADADEKEYAESFRHMNEIGELDNFITIRMTAFDDVIVKVNQWSYEEEQHKFDNKKHPYNDLTVTGYRDEGNDTQENEDLPF